MSDPHPKELEHLRGALHDVSNALTVILGWVEEAQKDVDPDSLEKILAVVEKRARAARDLARRAIGVAVTVVEEHETIDEAVTETVYSLEVEGQKAGVTIALTAGASGGHLLGASELSQVLGNLLLNAIAFTPPGGTVRVATSLEAQHVVVEVVDEGPGISEERREAIFNGSTTRRGGAGVGLAYARTVARANGGDVVLSSAGPHATFRIVWPRSGTSTPPPPLRPSVAPRPPSGLSGLRLLVLDDDRDITDLLETALGARGADVTVLRTADALSTVEGGFDVVLLDFSPIAKSVETSLATVKTRWPDAPVLVISGTVSVRALPGIELSRWVQKPFEVQELAQAIVAARSARSAP